MFRHAPPSAGHGLLQLGASETGTALPPVFGYWREIAARYMSALCARPIPPDSREHVPVPPPSDGELEMLAAAAPPMMGAEYLNGPVLLDLWRATDDAFATELREARTTLQEFLGRRSPAWNLVGRVHFNLAENRHDTEAPFAFLATYTTRLSAQAKAQHLPLGRALTEYAGAANRARLLSLLLPVQRAAEQCAWLRAMVDSGEIYHPLRWTPAEAWQLLTDLPRLEAAGVVVRVPTTWRTSRPPRPQVTATIGGKPPSGLGTDAVLDFRMEVTLDGEPLTAGEIETLLAASNGLHLVRGQWVELDRDRLARPRTAAARRKPKGRVAAVPAPLPPKRVGKQAAPACAEEAVAVVAAGSEPAPRKQMSAADRAAVSERMTRYREERRRRSR
jgi:hypothetical protein